MKTSWVDRIKEFVAQWYRDPLTPGDGATEEELVAVERELGAPLPHTLRTWFSLVDHRLREVQDRPVRLGELKGITERLVARGLLTREHHLMLWIENQGVWNISAPLHTNGPAIVSPEDEFGTVSGAVADVLGAMLLSDTLAGASTGHGKGPVGPLRDAVTGGYVEWRAECEPRVQVLPALDWFQNPHFEGPYRGDDTLIVRLDPSGWLWMASDENALERANQLFELARPGSRRIIVWFEKLTPSESEALYGGSPNALKAAVGDLGQLSSVGRPHEGSTLRAAIETRDPEACCERLLERLPHNLHDRMTISATPEEVSLFTILHPASKRGERWYPKETP